MNGKCFSITSWGTVRIIPLLFIVNSAPRNMETNMATAVTIDLSIDPARVGEFLAFIKEIAPDTRAYDGCRPV